MITTQWTWLIVLSLIIAIQLVRGCFSLLDRSKYPALEFLGLMLAALCVCAFFIITMALVSENNMRKGITKTPQYEQVTEHLYRLKQ